VQISNLEEAGYLEIKKEFLGKKPQTSAAITAKGVLAMKEYTEALREYLDI